MTRKVLEWDSQWRAALLSCSVAALGCGSPSEPSGSGAAGHAGTSAAMGGTAGNAPAAGAGGGASAGEGGNAGSVGTGGTSGAPGVGGTVAAGGVAGVGGAGGSPPTAWTCADCPDPPQNIEDWINGHGETMTLLGFDGHVAVYVDDDVTTQDAEWVLPFMSQSVAYIKIHYDAECHYGEDRLYVFLHQGNHGGGTISSYFDGFSDFRNAVDGGSNSWEQNLNNVNIDILSHELAHIVEGSSNCIHESPGFGVWGDSKWAEIFQYDLYVGLGMTDHADKVFERFSNNGDPWFQEFYYPMYEQYGGVRVLDGFFKLLSEHFPTRLENNDQNPIYTRRATLGELVHFYSGAAGADVSNLAEAAFDNFNRGEFEQAQADFPEVTY